MNIERTSKTVQIRANCWECNIRGMDTSQQFTRPGKFQFRWCKTRILWLQTSSSSFHTSTTLKYRGKSSRGLAIVFMMISAIMSLLIGNGPCCECPQKCTSFFVPERVITGKSGTKISSSKQLILFNRFLLSNGRDTKDNQFSFSIDWSACRLERDFQMPSKIHLNKQ